jgi:formylglycine-generating enzyme required for sulfatase activity
VYRDYCGKRPSNFCDSLPLDGTVISHLVLVLDVTAPHRVPLDSFSFSQKAIIEAAMTSVQFKRFSASIFTSFACLCSAGCSGNQAASSKSQIILDQMLGEQNFVKVQPGSFWMGDEEHEPTDEHYELRMRPRHQVEITKPFELSKYEVTQAQWQAVMGTNPSHFKGDNLPVESVSWNDVQLFLKRVQPLDDKYIYRLPTEAEWEYACRAGSTGLFSGQTFASVEEAEEAKDKRGKVEERERAGEKAKAAKKEYKEAESPRDARREMEREARKDTPAFYKELLPQAWFRINAQRSTHPVGQLQANAWGLYDMQGNVAELCQDWFAFGYTKEPIKDPQGPETGTQRINRGGSWQMPASYCRAAVRLYGDVNEKQSIIGFRLARQAQSVMNGK